jgi:sulfite reductase alpha subunit-like flavoprotein
MTQLCNAILKLYPLPSNLSVLEENSAPHPRILMKNASVAAGVITTQPIESDPRYHTATVLCNRRITAGDWYQDVRHIEFSFQDDIR